MRNAMKRWKIVFLLLCTFPTLRAQERILLSPLGAAIPIEKGKGVAEVVNKSSELKQEAIFTGDCPTQFTIGGCNSNIFDCPPYNTNFAYNAGDIAAMVYVVPVSGVVEAAHFVTNSNTFTNLDASIRIFKALVVGGGSSATWYGYFPDSNDAHTGRTAFPESATGLYVPGDPGTQNIIGDELWGNGGFHVEWPNSAVIKTVNMIDLGYEPQVNAGDTIVITVQKTRFDGHPDSSNAVLRATSPPAVPFRFFKYYDHNRLPGKPGWWSREYDMFIWLTARRTDDLPPTITSMTPLNHMLDTGPRDVCFSAYDCNSGNPADTGVAAAKLVYRVNNGPWDTLSFVHTDSGWCAQIPGQPPGSVVTYFFIVTDIHGYSITTGARTYRDVALNRSGYTTTFPTFDFINVAGAPGATELPGSAFFSPNPSNEPFDDGTAGPVPIGGDLNFFGRDTMKYVWIGVNGGISLTGTATDTIHVNSGPWGYSFFSADIPGPAPRNFIAPFWNDLYLAPGGHGSVWYKHDGTQLIIQWNKVGNFNDTADTNTTFQVVLDKTDSSITFKYLDVGTTGLNMQCLVGAQASSTNDWVFINLFGYPDSTRPRNERTIKMTYTGPLAVPGQGDGVPSKFALFSNYPNPFNPTTIIRYELPKQTKVSLRVYNLLGQEVAVLVNGEQQAGRYEMEFDGKGLASGVYFYRLQAGVFMETKKLMLLK